MPTDPYTHMEEAFGLDENPFPGEGISSGEPNPSATPTTCSPRRPTSSA